MAGTDRTRPLIAEGPAIVLVEPQLGENIGTAARAMANFGLADLRLVSPRDGWPNERARATASRADHVLDAARVFDTLQEAVADIGYLTATTARPREISTPVLGPRAAAEALRSRYADGVACGILFGREKWGLSNDEVALADAIITFPVNPAFASLNLAQSVLLVAYEWMVSAEDGAAQGRFDEMPALDPPAPRAELERLFEHLERALSAAGYFRSPDMRPSMMRNLRAMWTRAAFTAQEVRTLRGVLAALERSQEERRAQASSR